MQAQVLAPAAALVVWSILILIWTGATRFPALAKLERGAIKPRPGIRGQDLEGVLPDNVSWKSHNYTHLMEQPTLFYAAVVIIALMGAAAGDVLAAWIYVALRVVHSLWQATVNRIPVRFSLFLLSTSALIYLAYRAVVLTFFATAGA